MPAFSTTRETTVAATPATLHALIDDFHEWIRWSPWEGQDPQLERSYSGPDCGVGTHYAWSGNNKAGQGSMTITESTQQRIAIDLEFLKPFKAKNTAVFALTPVGDQTGVSWTMSGRRNLAFAVLGRLFFDKAIAKDFDRGLAALKAAAESTA